MSVDVYLLPLQPQERFDDAMALLEGLDKRTIEMEAPFDVRPTHTLIKALDPRYEVMTHYSETAKYIPDLKGHPADHFIVLQGKSATGAPLSQFYFHKTHVVIHEYDGTTYEQTAQFIDAICRATGLSAVYPAFSEVHRVGDEGWFSE